MDKNYKVTFRACAMGILMQGLLNNLAAVLFIPLKVCYGLSYAQLGAIVLINFITQVIADVALSGAVDKKGYRPFVIAAPLMAFVGLLLFALTPFIFKNHIFAGLIISTVIFAFAGGLLEMLMSPIVDRLPSENKTKAMSMMHSYFSWGQAGTVLFTTLLVLLLGYDKWWLIVLMWTVVPLIDFAMFLKAPMPDTPKIEKVGGVRKVVFKPYFLLSLLILFTCGAAEVVMAQWSSSIMERGLGLDKVYGDIFGVFTFALMMALGRLFYGKFGHRFNVRKMMIISCCCTVLCYIAVAFAPTVVAVIACGLTGLSVALLWPGNLSLTAEHYPKAGTWLFGLLAATGDMGCSAGPWLTGVIADKVGASAFGAELAQKFQLTAEQVGLKAGILFGIIFPILCVIAMFITARLSKKTPIEPSMLDAIPPEQPLSDELTAKID